MSLSFENASSACLPFGKYQGIQLDVIATTDEGLLYLDWLVGQGWLRGDLRSCVETYLREPCIEAELKALLERRQG